MFYKIFALFALIPPTATSSVAADLGEAFELLPEALAWAGNIAAWYASDSNRETLSALHGGFAARRERMLAGLQQEGRSAAASYELLVSAEYDLLSRYSATEERIASFLMTWGASSIDIFIILDELQASQTRDGIDLAI